MDEWMDVPSEEGSMHAGRQKVMGGGTRYKQVQQEEGGERRQQEKGKVQCWMEIEGGGRHSSSPSWDTYIHATAWQAGSPSKSCHHRDGDRVQPGMMTYWVIQECR